jgi:hypothetical protein
MISKWLPIRTYAFRCAGIVGSNVSEVTMPAFVASHLSCTQVIGSVSQSRDDCVRGVNERIITITSEENLVLQAVGRILKKCLEDKAFEEYRTTSLASSATGSLLSGMQVLF